MATFNLNNFSDDTVQGTTAQADTITLNGRGSNAYIDAGAGNDLISASVGGLGGGGAQFSGCQLAPCSTS